MGELTLIRMLLRNACHEPPGTSNDKRAVTYCLVLILLEVAVRSAISSVPHRSFIPSELSFSFGLLVKGKVVYQEV